MDPVRFGRALGSGARAAARTVVQAADAAAAPNSSARQVNRQSSGQSSATQPAPARNSRTPEVRGRAAALQTRAAAGGVREGTRRFGRAVWEPTVRLSGVLWLEFAGVFFGIFALTALGAAVRLRGAWHPNGANNLEHQRLLGALGMFAVFTYFCITSFVRAKRRERRR